MDAITRIHVKGLEERSGYQAVKFHINGDSEEKQGIVKTNFLKNKQGCFVIVRIEQGALGYVLHEHRGRIPEGLQFDLKDRLNVLQQAITLTCSYITREDKVPGAKRINRQLNVFYEEICRILSEGPREYMDESLPEKSMERGENKGEV